MKQIVTPHGTITVQVIHENGDWMKLSLAGLTKKLKVVAVTVARSNLSREQRFELQPGQAERTWPISRPKVHPDGADLRLRLDVYGSDDAHLVREEWVIIASRQSLAEGSD